MSVGTPRLVTVNLGLWEHLNGRTQNTDVWTLHSGKNGNGLFLNSCAAASAVGKGKGLPQHSFVASGIRTKRISSHILTHFLTHAKMGHRGQAWPQNLSLCSSSRSDVRACLGVGQPLTQTLALEVSFCAYVLIDKKTDHYNRGCIISRMRSNQVLLQRTYISCELVSSRPEKMIYFC